MRDGKLITDPAVIRDILVAMKLDPKPVFDRTQSDAIKTQLREQTEEAQRLGIFGAPSFVANGELFWGNDRLEQAIAWAKREMELIETVARYATCDANICQYHASEGD